MKRNYLLFTAAIFLFCSCSAKAQTVASPDLANAFADAGLTLLKEKVSPRNFSLPVLTGGTQSLNDLQGKVVFLNFWATWCGPCREEMPSMEALYNRYKDRGLEIIAVNSGEKQTDVFNFMKNNKLTFPAWLDEDARISISYGIQAIPTSFLIDRDGKIILRLVGSINWDTPKIHTAFETLLSM